MIYATTGKLVVVTPPAAILDNTAITTTAVDTNGYAWATFYVLLGATDIAMAALKMTESDASGSGYTDITGLDYSTDGTLPSATDDNKIFAFDIDLRGGRKRYLDVVATAGDGTAGTYCAIWAVLHRASELPSSAADRGLAATLLA